MASWWDDSPTPASAGEVAVFAVTEVTQVKLEGQFDKRRVANRSLSLYLRVRSELGQLAKVLGRHLIEEFPELFDFVLSRNLRIGDVDPGFIKEVIGSPDRHLGTKG